MTTARDIIKRSLRQLGVYSIGEEPSADEASEGLEALNAMLDSWANENLFVYAKTLDTVPMLANQLSFTIGPTGSVVSTRPVTIDASSYVMFQGVSYPLQKFTDQEYQSISLKTQVGGIPRGFWPLMNYPDVTVTLWPFPSQDMTVMLWSNKLVKSFADLTTDVDLPPGYERALVYSLAEEISSEYEVMPSASLVTKGAQARRNIKRTNTQVPVMGMPYGIPLSNDFYSNGQYW